MPELAKDYSYYNDWYRYESGKPIITEWPVVDFKLYDTTGGNKNMAKTVSASEIGVGDVINVVHEGQEVSGVSKDGGEILIETRKGETVWPTTNGNAPTRFELVKKAKKKPANWPPKYNDVWRASHEWGGEYYYHVNQSGSLFYGGFSTKSTPDSVFENYDNLELVFRAK